MQTPTSTTTTRSGFKIKTQSSTLKVKTHIKAGGVIMPGGVIIND